MLQFSLTGVDEALSNLHRVSESVKGPEMTEGAMMALEPVAEDARDLAPVRFGDLRDGITISADLPNDAEPIFNGRSVFVGLLEGVPFYAGFLELGTVKMRAQPYLGPAVDANEALVFEILGRETGKLMLGAL